jgi:hypothetical protein
MRGFEAFFASDESLCCDDEGDGNGDGDGDGMFPIDTSLENPSVPTDLIGALSSVAVNGLPHENVWSLLQLSFFRGFSVVISDVDASSLPSICSLLEPRISVAAAGSMAI